jgi:hypothetical protein
MPLVAPPSGTAHRSAGRSRFYPHSLATALQIHAAEGPGVLAGEEGAVGMHAGAVAASWGEEIGWREADDESTRQP